MDHEVFGYQQLTGVCVASTIKFISNHNSSTQIVKNTNK